METTQLLPEWKAAADEIWAVLKETDRIVKETALRQAETDRIVKETALRQAETDRQMKETDRQMKETDRQMKETDRQLDKNARETENLRKTVERVSQNVGGLNRSLGELIETLIAARLWEKFPEYNLKRAYQRMPVFDEKSRVLTDIDILLSNTGVAMAVEVKRELNKKEDVSDHLKRMELIRKHPPAEAAGKRLFGAMAGGVVDPDVQRYACESGFYVLELSGETVRLVPQPEGFEPKQW